MSNIDIANKLNITATGVLKSIRRIIEKIKENEKLKKQIQNIQYLIEGKINKIRE